MARKSHENFECIICYEKSAVTMKIPCGHEFCASCIFRTYAQVSKRCPLCREPFPEKFEDYKVKIIPFSLEKLNQTELQNNFAIICSHGNLKNVQKCVDLGVDIHENGNFGRSPLYASAQNGQLSIVKYLVEKGVNVNQTMKGGISPLYISSQNGHFSVVKFLIKNGADVNLLLKNGASPLLIASQHGHFSVVKHLVQKGEANVNQCLANGISALFLSCHNEHFSTVKFLLQNGANVNQALNDGTTPLSATKHIQITKYLLQHGARP